MTSNGRDIEEIFSAALERTSATERRAFLDGACGADNALRARVDTLLAAHEEARGFLDPATIDAPSGPPEGLSEQTGASIGRYKLLQLIGEGGFGAVYMAEQQEPVQRKVALKIIKRGMDTKQVIARFEAERQALAMMEHPHIAKVLDAGATAAGRPYFVMELVRGVPLTEYCDTNNLTTRERLDLFVPICSAIQHAHQKGVIHRDLKPTNVMVTLHDGRPVPKVIDFGIAKATSRRLTEKTLFTEYHQFVGTPAYMSPEQAEMSGLDVDTRSDVYSLGVLLYEILTGTTPFEPRKLREAGYAEITRIIREEDPPTPSTRVSMLGDELDEIARHRRAEPGALRRLLRGDLDWIVMKALEKDRTRRYETAEALASDVTRHLRSEPVLAGPPRASYKLAKFVRRHRLGVVAGMLITTSLVAGLTVATVGFVQARREAARSRAIIESLQGTLALVDPERVRSLDIDAQSVLEATRDAVAGASPMPVAFGKYAELDPFRAADWDGLADSVAVMQREIGALVAQQQRGAVVDTESQQRIQKENMRLARLAIGLIGQIPTHTTINGEFTHPLVLINLAAAVLDKAKLPLTSGQKAQLAAIGNEYENRYERRQASYSDATPRLGKVIDELELKKDAIDRMFEKLTPEQRAAVSPAGVRHVAQVDVLSPALSLAFVAHVEDYTVKERVRASFADEFAERFHLEPKHVTALAGALDAWYAEIEPLLDTVRDAQAPVHLDEAIKGGRAMAKLSVHALELPDLPERARGVLLANFVWLVPRLTSKPPEAIERRIAELRRRSSPRDDNLAGELDSLANALAARGKTVEAIAALEEAIAIYRERRGETWNADPLRYRLRNMTRTIAFDSERTPEEYEHAHAAAERVLALKPESASSLQTLGALEYRMGRYAVALETLRKADALHRERYENGTPVDLAFLAMTHWRLGDVENVRTELARLRSAIDSGGFTDDEESQRAFAEAEALLDRGGGE